MQSRSIEDDCWYFRLEGTGIMTPQERVNEAAWELIDSMNEAESAQGYEDKQFARWDCTEAKDKLKKALEAEEESRT
jgi:hypothetical protein